MIGLSRRWMVLCLFALALALALSGCAGQNAAAPAAASPSEKQTMLEYLQTSADDLKVIDTLIADEALGLLDEDSSEAEEVTEESLGKYLGILSDYDTRLRTRVDDIKKRESPDHPNVADFRAAELAEFELSTDVIEEYIQVLKYMDSLLSMSDQMDKLGDVDASDLEGTYKAFNTGIDGIIEDLKDGDVPTFLESMNNNLIASLNDMNDAVLYSLNAVALDDPLRNDAAEYRLEILTRKFSKVMDDAQKDLDDRQKKLTDDMKGIKTTNEGLRDWLERNIDRLD